jgi:Uma2 family endonuclease
MRSAAIQPNGPGAIMTTTFVVERDSVTIPAWVDDLESFRRWVRSDDFPETGRICFLDGEVWVDMSKEQLFTHNQVKGEYTFVLYGLAKKARLGRYFTDGARLYNEPANFSSVPDGLFAFTETFRAGRLRLGEGVDEGYVELEGTPDMVLEIVSTSSVGKDTDRLRQLYWRAGIPEYWIVDARGEPLSFEILRHTVKGYVATRASGGWLKSNVFGKSFRLMRRNDEGGNPEYELAVR